MQPIVIEPHVCQQGLEGCLQLFDRPVQLRGWQFFCTNFKKEISPVCIVRLGKADCFRLHLHCGLKPGIAHLFALSNVGFTHLAGKIAHLAKKRLALGETNRASGVQHIEGVGALDHIVISRQDQPLFEGVFCFLGKEIEHLPQAGNIGSFIIVGGMFALRHLVDVSVKTIFIPTNVLEMVHTLQRHGDPFQPVGQFNRRHIQDHTAGLLEVSKLGDFLPIQPDFPTQTPG